MVDQTKFKTKIIDVQQRIDKIKIGQLLMFQEFAFVKEAVCFHRYPDDIIQILPEIGGLIAILKVGVLLSVFHKKLFDW